MTRLSESLTTASSRFAAIVFTIIVLLSVSSVAWAQQPKPDNGGDRTAAMPDRAQIMIDGRPLFSLRGVSSYPAVRRVAEVRDKIIALAKDESFSVDDLSVKDLEDRSIIYAGDAQVADIYDVDAELEGIDRKLLARAHMGSIKRTIISYRSERSSTTLLTNLTFFLGLTALTALLWWGVLRLFRWLDTWAVRHVQKNLDDLANKSHQLIRAGQIWSIIAGLQRALRVLVFVMLGYFYLNTVLGLFPWSRPAAIVLFDLVLNPLRSLWFGFVDSIPNITFLIILFFIIRYLLKLTRVFFKGVSRGTIKLQNFDRDWADPTYKIVRFLVIAFGIVLAYPYIPGSDSLAFKGVSVFVGIIFSLGSSSFIANLMAGLAMTYRGAYKVGDRIRVGEVVGRVEEIKLMDTRIRTPKNESVVLPNSNILGTHVINYSILAREQGLVVHSIVGIGYDVPWRQVQAMLLMAADRTPGLKKKPVPFVLQTSLGDFAANYEINAFCNDEPGLLKIYSDLHGNIQDVFNEHGVQIMSPAYESDPSQPKIVPPEQWYAEPAIKPKS